MEDTKFKVLPPTLVIWEDILYACEYQQLEFYMDFKVYDLIGSYTILGESKMKYIFGGTMDEVHDTHTNADVYCSGSVKWDGCSNFKFDEQEDCMLHTCDKERMVSIGVMLGRVYDLAKVTD